MKRIYIERVCAVFQDSPQFKMTILKIVVKETRLSLIKSKVIYIQGKPITHTVDETFNIQKHEVIDFIDYNHTLV